MNEQNPNIEDAARLLKSRITAEVSAHERKLRVLSRVALTFGLLAIGASILIVFVYCVLYRPKQMQLLKDFGTRIEQTTEKPGATTGAPNAGVPDFLRIQAIMMHASSFGTMLVAIAVGLLAAGTLTTQLLVIATRRATLSQINSSLAAISQELKTLR